ncbi:DUF6862 domain-containing protein [Erwinia sp. P7711]|uniref:DUF6862 domain-containing protein n=1 Tax=Erwinia sp. P7711 TaxID=3141451 RepID=UPI00319725DE
MNQEKCCWLASSASKEVIVENNALHAEDEKQRQDAKWSLPYLEGEKKEQAEKLISDLNAKDKAFDNAIDAACQNLSSDQCKGLRQDLAAMANSYDRQLDGQYIGTMGSVYKEGKGQVDALIWQYATADAKAEREANVNRIAENWGVSKETADGIYTAMAGVHTTAAIGGAAYGMKDVKEPATAQAKPSTPSKGSTLEETKPSTGAENAATYSKLKDELIQQNLNNIAKQDPRLAAVVQGGNGKLNYGVGSGSASEADRLGKVWVGDGARLTSDGSGLMSADKTRVYRFPASKENSSHATTGTQANFETYKINPVTGDKTKIGNGHLDIN